MCGRGSPPSRCVWTRAFERVFILAPEGERHRGSCHRDPGVVGCWGVGGERLGGGETRPDKTRPVASFSWGHIRRAINHATRSPFRRTWYCSSVHPATLTNPTLEMVVRSRGPRLSSPGTCPGQRSKNAGSALQPLLCHRAVRG